MGLLSQILSTPLEVQAHNTLWLARKFAQVPEADRQGTAFLQSAMRAAEEELLSGDLSEADYAEVETEILIRLGTKLR